MKYSLLLLWISIVMINAFQQPCEDDSNVKTCICKNGRTYYQSGAGSIRFRCLESVNPIVSCVCYDGTTWEADSGDEDWIWPVNEDDEP